MKIYTKLLIALVFLVTVSCTAGTYSNYNDDYFRCSPSYNPYYQPRDCPR